MRNVGRWTVASAVALMGLSTAASSAAAQRAPAVLMTMSPAEAQATGVDKLTWAERTRLEAWIARLSANVAYLTASSVCQATPTTEPASQLESRIAGDFTGWDGSTVVMLENGQVWQQASFDRVATYVQRPRVELSSSGSDWRMAVEGITRTVPVRRLR